MRYDLFDGVKTVWFDLDDTLIDFEANSRAALRRVFDLQTLAKMFDSPEQWIDVYEYHNKRLWVEYARGSITRERLRLERFMKPFVEAGCHGEEAERLSRLLDPLYLDCLAEEKRLIPGAKDLLDKTRTRGFRVGVLSNGFAEVQYRKIDSAGLTPLIDIVVLSDDIGVNKPDVRLFRHAAEKSSTSLPSSNLMIGDNPETDVTGALNAGWRAVWFDRHNNPELTPEGAVRAGTLKEIIDSF